MLSDTVQRVRAVIELLEQVRTVPHMYMVRHDRDLAVSFLRGVQTAVERMLGIASDGEVRRRVWEDRGWEPGACGPIFSIRHAGLTDEAMVDELVAIEIEVWKRVASAPTDPRTVPGDAE